MGVMARPKLANSSRNGGSKTGKGKKRRADALEDDDRNDFFLDDDKADTSDAEETDEIEETAEQKRLRLSKSFQQHGVFLHNISILTCVAGCELVEILQCLTLFSSAGKRMVEDHRSMFRERGVLLVFFSTFLSPIWIIKEPR